jgi:hypothetical protein
MTDVYSERIQKVLTVGLTPVKFPALLKNEIFQQPDAIMIQGVFENTGRFFIGKSDVTADYTKGCFLFPPGLADAILPFNDEENTWVVSNVAAQTLMITYLAN